MNRRQRPYHEVIRPIPPDLYARYLKQWQRYLQEIDTNPAIISACYQACEVNDRRVIRFPKVWAVVELYFGGLRPFVAVMESVQ